MDRIVYLSPEGDLLTIAPNGREPAQPLVRRAPSAGSGAVSVSMEAATGPRRLDLSIAYAWPTWSPDGRLVAASRLRVAGNQLEVSVQVVDVATGESRTAYTNDTPGMMAEGTPHYLCWSPDSRSLALLATGPEALTLLVQDLEAVTGAPAVRVAAGAPLFCHWHPEGRALLLHHGDDVVLAPRPFHRTDARQLLASGDGFRVAAFSSDGRRLAYVSAGDGAAGSGGNQLVVAELASGLARRVLEVGHQAAFLWSPNGLELAVADQEDSSAAAYSRLRIVPAEGGPARTLVAETLLAFFWSPDGRRMAWVALDLAEQRVLWKAISTEPRAPIPSSYFFSFQPAAQVLTLLQFFDQYAFSHSLWSPDSSRMVVAGTRQPVDSRRNGHTPTGDRVWVLDPSGVSPPVDLAAGGLAFWSWQ